MPVTDLLYNAYKLTEKATPILATFSFKAHNINLYDYCLLYMNKSTEAVFLLYDWHFQQNSSLSVSVNAFKQKLKT